MNFFFFLSSSNFSSLFICYQYQQVNVPGQYGALSRSLLIHHNTQKGVPEAAAVPTRLLPTVVSLSLPEELVRVVSSSLPVTRGLKNQDVHQCSWKDVRSAFRPSGRRTGRYEPLQCNGPGSSRHHHGATCSTHWSLFHLIDSDSKCSW